MPVLDAQGGSRCERYALVRREDISFPPICSRKNPLSSLAFIKTEGREYSTV